MRRGGDRTSSALLRTGRLRIRSAALPGADRAKDQRAGPGCAARRLAAAGRIRHATASSGSPDGQAWKARVRAGSTADGGIPRRRGRGCGARCHRAWSNRIRCREASGAVPHRTATAAPRYDDLSVSTEGPCGDDGGQDVSRPADGDGILTDTPPLLLAHHLTALKLPTN